MAKIEKLKAVDVNSIKSKINELVDAVNKILSIKPKSKKKG